MSSTSQWKVKPGYLKRAGHLLGWETCKEGAGHWMVVRKGEGKNKEENQKRKDESEDMSGFRVFSDNPGEV